MGLLFYSMRVIKYINNVSKLKYDRNGGEQNGSGNNEYPYGCGLEEAV